MKKTKLERKLNDELAKCLECGESFHQDRDIQLCDKCMNKFDLDKLWKMHDNGELDALDFNESKMIKEKFRLKVNVKMKINPDNYIDEYISYAKSFIEDPDADLTEIESFNEWIEEEEYEQKIRCRECGSFNTEQRETIKHCTDCKHEDKITSDNWANWKISVTKEESEKIKSKPKEKDVKNIEQN